jgi:hypothetical protein
MIFTVQNNKFELNNFMLQSSNKNKGSMQKSIENRNVILKAIVSCTSLVIFGIVLYSTVGIYFLPAWRDITTLLPAIKFIIIGLILGDFSFSFSGKGASLGASFTMKSFSFVWHLLNLFSHYCQSFPFNNVIKLNGKQYPIIGFKPRSYLCFAELYHLFYVNGIKVIPACIGILLNAEGLAYWAICDGGKSGSGFNLNTQSFTYQENLFLAKGLKEQFNLNCSVHANEKGYRLYILAESMSQFRALVTPFFILQFYIN